MLELSTAVSTIVGASIALGGVWLTNKETTRRFFIQMEKDERRAKCDIVRQRGEELYETMSEWVGLITARERIVLRTIRERSITAEEEEKLGPAELLRINERYPRIMLLIEVYFHDLLSAFDYLTTCRGKLLDHQQDYFYKRDRTTDDIREGSEKHRRLIQDFDAARAAFLSLLANAIRST